MKKTTLFFALFFCSLTGIFCEPFDITKFNKMTSEHTVATFQFEGTKVTVTDLEFWKTYLIGPFSLMSYGIYIDEELYRLYLAGDIKAKFILTHELGHLTFHHNLPMNSVDPAIVAQYTKNEVAVDVWAANRLKLGFPEYEVIRKWIDREYFKDFINRVGATANWDIILAEEKKQIAGVAELLK
jgi:hypothetical protein